MSWAPVIILIDRAVLAAKSKAATFHGRPDLFPCCLIFLLLIFYKNSQSCSAWETSINSWSQQLNWFCQNWCIDCKILPHRRMRNVSFQGGEQFWINKMSLMPKHLWELTGFSSNTLIWVEHPNWNQVKDFDWDPCAGLLTHAEVCWCTHMPVCTQTHTEMPESKWAFQHHAAFV